MNRCNNVIEIFSITISSEFLNIVFHSIAKCKKKKKERKMNSEVNVLILNIDR